jgi:4-phosphopantoate--beta-alanine ligase
MAHEIPESHPRRISLLTRDKLIKGFDNKLVAAAGLIAHGRGEAFDYLLGEATTVPAQKSIEAAAALLLQAENATISVNGNVAALTPEQTVELASLTAAALEINLFYRSLGREQAIAKVLKAAGAGQVLGVGKAASAHIPHLESERGRVDPRGIEKADVVLVALEDGDRTEHLVAMGKKVIAIDLNPFSRTAQYAQVSIVDNVVRVMPALIEKVRYFLAKKSTQQDLEKIIKAYNNKKVLGASIAFINKRLTDLAAKGVFL